nr:energy transducer TonB [Acinetobacter sp. Marseille-Q1620]
MQKERKLLRAQYHLGARIWWDSSGKMTRVELIGSTGNPDTDEILQDTILKAPRPNEVPPNTLQQPVRIEVRSS